MSCSLGAGAAAKVRDDQHADPNHDAVPYRDEFGPRRFEKSISTYEDVFANCDAAPPVEPDANRC